uniref:Uncharacterized protein n=1 Tax=Quercus lobata TaxID=97700 RepID=A0A7N2LAY0_QUELO
MRLQDVNNHLGYSTHSRKTRNKEKQRLFRKPGDVLATSENYIEEHGTEAFEMLIATSKVTRGGEEQLENVGQT